MSADNEHENSAETLLQSGQAWNDQHIEHYPAGKPEITVMKMTIPAHSELPWHTHPMPNTAYILSGSLTIEDKASGETKTFNAGEAFNESIDIAHRGFTTDQRAELIIFYAGVEGMELSIPLPGEKAEY
ncbi:cupin domain-containing protein [Pantoea endophytica]|uniref:cupin domain-containing protein n=1 Tax=Pantoea endophytica TaxID=92488 RepID=UPI001AE89277|nr:cupin domain-containing protein [Pantoea endophytica]